MVAKELRFGSGSELAFGQPPTELEGRFEKDLRVEAINSLVCRRGGGGRLGYAVSEEPGGSSDGWVPVSPGGEPAFCQVTAGVGPRNLTWSTQAPPPGTGSCHGATSPLQHLPFLSPPLTSPWAPRRAFHIPLQPLPSRSPPALPRFSIPWGCGCLWLVPPHKLRRHL